MAQHLTTPRLINRLKRLWLKQRQRSGGFTLLELLVSMIIGALIVVALLSLVVELTDTNQKDAARTATQQEMQAAMDYIVRDLREAVYVYDGKCLSDSSMPTFDVTNTNQFAKSCPKLTDHLPTTLTASGRLPVLAFWRTDPLPSDLTAKCSTAYRSATSSDSTDPAAVIGVPCLSGRSYTLVVYTIANNTANNPSGIWKGRARIERYTLPEYTTTAGASTPTSGYVRPLQTPSAKFFQWPYEQTKDTSGTLNKPVNQQTVRPSNTSSLQVLVDYVDDSPNAFDPATKQFRTGEIECGNPDPINITDNNWAKKINVITPSTNAVNANAATKIRSFYACVRGNTIDAQDVPDTTGLTEPNAKITEKKILTSEQAINQEILLVLQGSVSGRPGFPRANSALEQAQIEVPATRLSPIQTRVLVRGAIQKNPI